MLSDGEHMSKLFGVVWAGFSSIVGFVGIKYQQNYWQGIEMNVHYCEPMRRQDT